MAILLVSVAACGGEEPTTEIGEGEAGRVEEPIIGGGPIPTSDLPRMGVVHVIGSPHNGGGLTCTGVLLTDRWVLTALHCFCPDRMTATVSVYGANARAADPFHAALYQANSVAVIPHPTTDAALIKLDRTLPFTRAPAIYTGNGAELAGRGVTQWGFGSTAAELRVNTTTIFEADVGMAGRVELNCSDPLQVKPGSGPIIRPVATDPGDSGGPLFLSDGTLVGVLTGDFKRGTPTQHYDGYIGIWTLRDWIKQHMGLFVPMASAATVTLPNSNVPGQPALADAADGLHVFAAQSDSTIGHWLYGLSGPLKVGTVPGAVVQPTDAVGAGLERTGSKLGVAWRDKTSTRLKYARYNPANGTWTPPQSGPTNALGAGPAMTHGGPIVAVKSTGLVMAVFFDPATGTFGPYRPLPASAPTADLFQRLSVVYDPALTGVTTVGYRKINGEFVRAIGTLACSTYFCGTEPAFGAPWQSAMLANTPGQRLSVVTTDSQSHIQNYVVADTYYPWGQGAAGSTVQPGVAQIGEDLYYVGKLPLSTNLFIARADNFFANTF